MYLTEAAVNQTLTWISHNSDKGSELVFDFLYSSALTPGKQPYEVRKKYAGRQINRRGIELWD